MSWGWDAWQHLHTIGMLCNSTLFNSKPSLPLSSSQFPFSEAFSNTFAAFATPSPLPRKYASKNFLSWGFKERGGNAIVAIFYFASSCKWSKVHHNTKLLTTYQHQNVNERHISPLSEFEEYFWALSSLGKRAQT